MAVAHIQCPQCNTPLALPFLKDNKCPTCGYVVLIDIKPEPQKVQPPIDANYVEEFKTAEQKDILISNIPCKEIDILDEYMIDYLLWITNPTDRMQPFSKAFTKYQQARDALSDIQYTQEKDYGYSMENPIMSLSKAHIEAFLKSLIRTDNKECRFEFDHEEAKTSIHGYDNLHVLAYNVITPGEKNIKLYLCPHGRISDHAPEGFIISGETYKDTSSVNSAIENDTNDKKIRAVFTLTYSLSFGRMGTDYSMTLYDNGEISYNDITLQQKLRTESVKAIKKLIRIYKPILDGIEIHNRQGGRTDARIKYFTFGTNRIIDEGFYKIDVSTEPSDWKIHRIGNSLIIELMREIAKEFNKTSCGLSLVVKPEFSYSAWYDIDIARTSAFDSWYENAQRKKEADELTEKQKQQLEKIKKAQEAEMRMRQYRKQKVCEFCGGEFKGVIFKVCTKCGRRKSY